MDLLIGAASQSRCFSGVAYRAGQGGQHNSHNMALRQFACQNMHKYCHSIDTRPPKFLWICFNAPPLRADVVVDLLNVPPLKWLRQRKMIARRKRSGKTAGRLRLRNSCATLSLGLLQHPAASQPANQPTTHPPATPTYTHPTTTPTHSHPPTKSYMFTLHRIDTRFISRV